SITGEVCLHYIESAIAIVVGDGHTHTGLRLAIGRVSDTGLDARIGESPVVIVPVKRGRTGIVCDVNVGPAVVVEIGDNYAEAVGSGGFQNAGRLGDVGERPISVVAEENVLAALQPGRTARHQQSLVLAGTGLGQRRGFRIEVNVI